MQVITQALRHPYIGLFFQPDYQSIIPKQIRRMTVSLMILVSNLGR
jgi:hypothetical protein